MSLDPELISSINLITKKLGQPEAVEKRLLSWLTDLSVRQISNSDIDQFTQNLISVIELNDESDIK